MNRPPSNLEKQRAESSTWDRRPKISLLIPLLDPPANFLNELFNSILSQTYDNWEACVVDAAIHEPRNDRFAAALDQND